MATEQTNTKAANKWNIPSDWELKELGEIADVKGGKRIPKGENLTVENTGFPYIRVSDMFMGGVDSSKILFVPKHIEPQIKNYKIRKGELFITVAGTIGLIGEIPLELDNANLTENANKIVVRGAENKYVLFYLMSEKIQGIIKETTTNNAQPKLALERIREIKILLPPLPEQKAIAKVLCTMDDAIQKQQQLIVQKEQRKKWLMQQLLTGKKRLNGFSGEWKECALGEVFTERNDTKYFDLPLLSIGQNGVYPQDESIKKDTSNNDKSKYKRICPGDIGYNTMRMWQGRSALSVLEGIVSPAYTVVTPKKNAESIFFSYLFKMPKMTNLFWRNSQGLVDDTLNCKYKNFSIVKVFLPQTKAEQTAIAQVLQAADKEISLLKAKTEKLKEQKKGMMQVLLTGKKRLRVKV